MAPDGVAAGKTRSAGVTYANGWSRLLLARAFREQFYIPPPPGPERFLLKGLEKFLEARLRPDSAGALEKPIFIVGAPRSGTSMLYDLLCAHERAAYVNNLANKYFETPLAIEWVRKHLRLEVQGERFLADSLDTNLVGPAEPFTFWGRWFGRNIESMYWAPQSAADLGPERVALLRSDLRKIVSTFATARPRFICKFATVQPELELLQELFPDARFVNIVRDGRAVAHSMIKLHELSNAQIKKVKHPLLKSIVPYPRIRQLQGYVDSYGADSIECTARVWQDTLALIDDCKDRLKHYYEFRYEDLLADPAGETRALLDFCDLEWPAAPLFRERLANVGKLRHANLYSQGSRVEEICADTLRRHEYL